MLRFARRACRTEKFRSAYHIACQWGSIKSLEFLLKLNSVMTIEDENENVTKNGKNEIHSHNVINELDQRRDENVGGDRIGSGFEIEIKYDDNNNCNYNNNDNNNNNNFNFKTTSNSIPSDIFIPSLI